MRRLLLTTASLFLPVSVWTQGLATTAHGPGLDGDARVSSADVADGAARLGRGRIVLAANLPASSTSSSPAGQDLGAGTSVSTGSTTARTLSARGADVFNPRDFGATGNGSSSTIGTTFGSTLAALAAYSVNGTTPYSWATNPAYGLTFTFTTSAGQTAAGTGLTFVSRLSGINGWSAAAASWSTPANGADIMQAGLLVSGAGIPAGTTVSSFAPATGVVTLSASTTAAVASGTAITFTLAPAQVQALTFDYLGLQSAAAAASSAGGGTVTIPAGHYYPLHPVFSLGVLNTNQLANGVDFQGAGQYATRLDFTTDYGSGSCALGESNRGPGSVGRSTISKLRLVGPGAANANTVGHMVAGMDGLCLGSKDHVDHVWSGFFHAGANILEDHGQIEASDLSVNYYGVYFAPNGDVVGNWDIADTYMVGEAWSGIGVAWNNAIATSHIKNVDVGGNSPYSFYREVLPTGQSTIPMTFISGTTIDNAMGESVGDGYIYGENAGDQITQNTFISGQPSIALSGNSAFQISGRSVKAAIYTGSLTYNTFANTDFSNNGSNMRQVADSLIETQVAISNNDFGNIGALIDSGSLTKPILNSTGGNGANHFNRFSTDRATGELDWTESGVTAGQIMSYGTQYNYFDVATGVVSATTTPRGIAAQTVAQYGMVPIITQGYAVANKTTAAALASGSPVCVSVATPASITTCAPGANIIGNDMDAYGATAAATTANIQVHLAPQPMIATTSVAGLVKPGSGLTVTADGTLSAGSGPAALLGSVSYNPMTAAAYASPGLAPATAIVDGTNLALTFTAPSSGSVLVRFTGYQVTSGVVFYLAVRDTNAGADVAGSFSRVTGETSSRHDYYEVKLTGLKPGQSYSWTPSYSCSSNTSNACYLSVGGTGTGAFGSMVFEVWAD